MTRVLLLVPFCVCFIGCSLNRAGIACAPDSPFPGCHPDAIVDGDAQVDANSLPGDGGVDAFIDGDAGPMPDAFMADAFVDPDVGVDSGVDAFIPDAFVPPDAFRPDAGVRRCEDTTSGVCIRLHNVSGDLPITGWNVQFIWTRVGGSLLTMPADGSYMAACSAFRIIDADTTECEIAVPDPGTPVLSGLTIYGFPVYPAAIPACSNTTTPACANFPGGYLLWRDGVSISTVPADGHFSVANRPYGAGMLRMIQITFF